MKTDLLPVHFFEINDSIYAGFWKRIGAMLLDFVIVLPIIFLFQYLNGLDRTIYYYTMIPYLLFFMWFHIYLVKRYGGTPGKLIVGIKIVKKNADSVDWQASIMRYIITIALTLISMIIMIVSLSMIDDSTYLNLDFWQRSKYLTELNPTLFKIQMWISNIWVYSEFIVLLTNDRKRSIHDFMAGTVVIKAKYHNKIIELINK
jgi:uncharacterized RDD family membrane protein YckC